MRNYSKPHEACKDCDFQRGNRKKSLESGVSYRFFSKPQNPQLCSFRRIHCDQYCRFQYRIQSKTSPVTKIIVSSSVGYQRFFKNCGFYFLFSFFFRSCLYVLSALVSHLSTGTLSCQWSSGFSFIISPK